jgi:8-oxo-dGTP diphosphatase
MGTLRTPSLTVDLIIEIPGGIVLIERRNPPLGWALPGGFVDYGESLERAAVREAHEETSLTVELLEQFYTYSDPARDPRAHNVSTVFLARADGTPVGADDAKRAATFSLDELPAPLCFDHARILADYREYRRTGRRPRPEMRGQP